MRVNSYDFILNSYSVEDIDGIIQDVKLLGEGTQFLYVLDTYDIVENYLPYIEFELFNSNDTNSLAQKYICYDFFFEKPNTTQVLLPDEYRIELLSVKNKLQRHLKEAKAVLHNLSKLREKFPDFSDEVALDDFLKKNFEIILLLLILGSKKNKILDEFKDFIRARLSISEIPAGGKNTEKLNEIFLSNKPGLLSVDLFKKYVDENKLMLVSISDEGQRQLFLENTFRDIQVIDRLYRINQILRENNLKYYAVYLSSAGKTPGILKQLKNFKSTSGSVINDLNFNRNIFQYFLFKKLSVEFKGETQKILDVLNTIRDIIERLTRSKVDSVDKDDESSLSLIQKIFEDASSTLDNHFYMSIFAKYRKLFNQSSSNIAGLITLKNVQKIFTDIDNNRFELESRISGLDLGLAQVNQSFDLIELFERPKRRVSKDLVRNSYQHLPILPFIDKSIQDDTKVSLYDFVDTIIEFGKENTPKNSSIRAKLEKILQTISSPNNSRERIVRTILLSYLNLHVDSGNLSEQTLISEFEAYYILLKNISISVDQKALSLSKSITYEFRANYYETEVCYILIWLYRRNERADDGIKLAEEILTKHPDDPRINQGLALCYLIKAYELISSSELPDAEKIFDKIEDIISKSLLGYKELEETSKELKQTNLIRKTQTALYNTLANIKLRRFDISDHRHEEYLNEAELLIDNVRSYLNKLNISFESHSTYLATQVELLYYKAVYYKNSSNLKAAKSNIIEASILFSTLSGLPEFKYSSDFFKEKFKRVPSLMSELITKK